MTLTVSSPLAGTVVNLSDVPDVVFAQGIVGRGLAIDPSTEATEALSPVGGVIVKIHPHAIMIEADSAHGLLFHLGIDTVALAGVGFERHVADGDRVTTGQRLISWSPKAVRSQGYSAVSPIIALQAPANAIEVLVSAGQMVQTGDDLFIWQSAGVNDL